MKTFFFTFILIISFTLSPGLSKAEGVYVSGAARVGTVYKAGYWLNSEFFPLGVGAYTSYGVSVFVSDGDVYVGGYESDGTKNKAKYWKNGLEVQLSCINYGNANASVQCIRVSGSTVYCAGYDRITSATGRVAMLWKDGVPIQLGNGVKWSSAQSIFISGTDIYIAGDEGNSSTGISEAKYWKISNGIVTTVKLPGSATKKLYATSIFKVGGDIYVAGYEKNNNSPDDYTANIPKYWKNGVAVNLSDASTVNDSPASSIYVSGTNIHIVGTEGSINTTPIDNSLQIPKYWLNGIETTLTANGYDRGKAKSIFVQNNNVYIAGQVGSATTANVATYWKNGAVTTLTSGLSTALSIMVVSDKISGTVLPPGVIVAHSPKSTEIYLGSPSICILDNGDYVASYNLNSANLPYSTNPETWVYRSSDKGKTWEKIAQLVNQYYSQLFVHRGALYILGTSKHAGAVIIRKSLDNGSTWTNPIDANTGVLADESGGYHTAPTPVILYNGRLWRAMEDVKGVADGIWGHSFRAFMMSVAENADLLKASNWTFSNKLGYNATYLNGDFGGWLEGNAVAGPNGIVDVLRTNYQKDGNELASIINISTDGKTATFNPQTGFVNFPGGCKKFAIRYDSQTNLYWSLSSLVPDSYKANNIERTRNTLALLYSSDLLNWNVKGIVLHHPDWNYHAFNYADFQFEGNDIVFVARTAYDDSTGGANSQHNANFFTFHRITDYKNYTTPDNWKPLFTNQPDNSVDIYVAGAVKNIADNFTTAGYWKNGIFTTLGTGSTTSYARSVFVSGDDVFVGGYEANSAGKNIAKYWKNGVVTNYSDGSSNASIQSVYVSGNDVYLAGYDGASRIAVYWKNGNRNILGSRYSMAHSVFVYGNDVYVAGNETGITGKSEAKYWKNGTEVLLEASATSDLYATSIFVSEGKVHVAGYEYNSSTSKTIPRYWENGISVANLSSGNTSTPTQPMTSSVFVSEGQVYISGNEVINAKDYARYWTSGGIVDLGVNQGTDASFGKSIYVHNSNVYVAGYEGNIAKYWKNGIATTLSTNSSSALSIMVVDKTQASLTQSNSSNIKLYQTGLSDNLENSTRLFFDRLTNSIVVKIIENNATIILYDSNGKQFLSKTISGDIMIPANTLPSGLYMARIVTASNITRYKFIK